MKSVFDHIILLLVMSVIATACSGRHNPVRSDVASEDSTSDEAVVMEKIPQPGDSAYHFSGQEEIEEYLENSPDAENFAEGILPVIARNAPEYADKLIAALDTYSKFIVVDKASMRVILYDQYGQVLKSYGMACAKNYGTKHKKADSRTPEGFFSVQGKYDSTEWLFTDDDGKTSPVKGQFGPRFIRLNIPTTSQIGIHGTGAPWSIGRRTSHGCIRITNENIMELYDLVEVGMPVIVLPGKKDRVVNREEGYDIAYFPTDSKYAISEKEKAGIDDTNRKKDSETRTDSIVTIPTEETKPYEQSMPSEETSETEMLDNIF